MVFPLIKLDGVYTSGKSGEAIFHRIAAPSQTALQTLLNRVIQRLVRRLERDGLLIADPEQPWLDLEFDQPMDTINAASVRYRIAKGPHSGSRTFTLHNLALIPRPRHYLVRYHGEFAPNARIRKLIVPTKRKKAKRENRHKPAAESRIQDELIAPLTWAQRLKRVFHIDITLCPVCGGTLRVIADITDPDIIQKILDHIQTQNLPGTFNSHTLRLY